MQYLHLDQVDCLHSAQAVLTLRSALNISDEVALFTITFGYTDYIPMRSHFIHIDKVALFIQIMLYCSHSDEDDCTLYIQMRLHYLH